MVGRFKILQFTGITSKRETDKSFRLKSSF